MEASEEAIRASWARSDQDVLGEQEILGRGVICPLVRRSLQSSAARADTSTSPLRAARPRYRRAAMRAARPRSSRACPVATPAASSTSAAAQSGGLTAPRAGCVPAWARRHAAGRTRPRVETPPTTGPEARGRRAFSGPAATPGEPGPRRRRAGRDSGVGRGSGPGFPQAETKGGGLLEAGKWCRARDTRTLIHGLALRFSGVQVKGPFGVPAPGGPALLCGKSSREG